MNPCECETIPAMLEALADLHGERDALVGGGARLTYLDLRQAVRQAAKGLVAMGIGHGDHVAILMDNRPEWVVSFLAMQQIGAVAVCLNTWATARELEYALGHADVKLLLAVRQFRRNDYRVVLDGMRPFERRLPALGGIVWFGADEKPPSSGTGNERSWSALLAGGRGISDETLDRATRRVAGDDVALLLYTSGSTAQPKGILLQQRWWIRNAWNIGERQGVRETDRLWLAVSLFWSFGCANALPNLMTHAGCVVLQEHFDAAGALDLIEGERCTLMYGTPNMVQALKDEPSRAGRDLSRLRGGAMIGTPEQLMAAVELGAQGICNIYGLSETYGNCAVTDTRDPLSVRIRSVGKPLPGVELRICDAQDGHVLAADQAGEIRVKGPLFLRYFKEPEKTREAFDEAGFFRTGDLGSIDVDGRLYYRGRLKEMVKTGGINVAPIEVEEVLMRHPAVHSAYVVGLPDPTLDEVLAAVIVLRPGGSVTAGELEGFCKRELAAYKIPRWFRMTRESELPLTTTGKLQKLKLRDLFEQSRPEAGA
jgi:fatty-acyl-CoA synthase